MIKRIERITGIRKDRKAIRDEQHDETYKKDIQKYKMDKLDQNDRTC